MESISLNQSAPSSQPRKSAVASVVVMFLVMIILLLLVLCGFLYVKSKGSLSGKEPSGQSQTVADGGSTQGMISGMLNINGVIPDGATLDLVATKVGTSSQSVIFLTGVKPQDNDAWTYLEAEAGSSYSIQARLVQNGQKILESSPVTVTAPATDEVLSLNVASLTATQNATITGDITVNGYIPKGATITVQGRVLGAQKFVTVASDLTGLARQVMTYTTAKAGTTYEVEGVLYDADGKTVLGTSDPLTVTAPAAHEVLKINSTATEPEAPAATKAPAPGSVISGSINFNGIAPANSRIVILAKVYNSSDYKVVVNDIKPVNGVTWTWKDPEQSTWYDVVAVLKQKQSDGADKDISTSSSTSVAAPATNVVSTLNSGFSLGAPEGGIKVSCGNLSGDAWNAQITFGPQSNIGAGSYWYQIGSTSGGVELENATQNVNPGDSVLVPERLKNNTSFYARYAVSTVRDIHDGDPQFSPFSPIQEIKCGP